MNSAAQGYFHKEVKHVINNIELEVQVTTIVITIVKADCKLLLPHIRKVQGEQPTCNSDWTKYSWCYIFLHNVLFYPVTPNQIIKKINKWMDILFCISQNEDPVYCFLSIIKSINSSGVVLTEVMNHSLRDFFLQPLWFFFNVLWKSIFTPWSQSSENMWLFSC